MPRPGNGGSRRRKAATSKAARHAWNLYRNGEGVERNPAIANQMAKVIGEPVQAPRANTAQTPAKK